MPLHATTDAIAGFGWTFDELAGHHLDLGAAMRTEAAHLARLATAAAPVAA